MDISTDRRLLILSNKMTMWQNTYYDAQVDGKIATDIENEQLLNQATERMKQALTAIAWLEGAITELEGGE